MFLGAFLYGRPLNRACLRAGAYVRRSDLAAEPVQELAMALSADGRVAYRGPPVVGFVLALFQPALCHGRPTAADCAAFDDCLFVPSSIRLDDSPGGEWGPEYFQYLLPSELLDFSFPHLDAPIFLAGRVQRRAHRDQRACNPTGSVGLGCAAVVSSHNTPLSRCALNIMFCAITTLQHMQNIVR